MEKLKERKICYIKNKKWMEEKSIDFWDVLKTQAFGDLSLSCENNIIMAHKYILEKKFSFFNVSF